jgi:hypothetical protein
MVAGPDPGRAVLHVLLIGFAIGDELLQILDRQILARDQQDRLLTDQRDGREVGHRIVERMLVVRLAMREGPGATEHELVSVGRSLRDAAGTGHAAGAADILDDHLLPKSLRQSRREYAADRIGRAAGGERNNHGHRPCRPILRRGSRWDEGMKHTADRDRVTQQGLRAHRPSPYPPLPTERIAQDIMGRRPLRRVVSMQRGISTVNASIVVRFAPNRFRWCINSRPAVALPRGAGPASL